MKLVRINNRFYNLDHLISAEWVPPRAFQAEDHDPVSVAKASLLLKFAAPEGELGEGMGAIEPYRVRLEGAVAEDMFACLNNHADDIAGDSHDDSELNAIRDSVAREVAARNAKRARGGGLTPPV